MTDRPILFSGPMVRAILDGRKTQTRRVLKPQPNERARGCYARPDGSWVWLDAHRENNGTGYTGTRIDDRHFFTPYAPGDQLWVRESLHRDPHLWKYKADGVEVGWPARRDLASRQRDYAPSIHMPRIASRLTLTVTDVRVQRVQEISDQDALAEGVEWAVAPVAGRDVDIDGDFWPEGPRRMFSDLWDSLNSPRGYGWDADPWVVAISFDVHRGNIDQMGEA